MAENNKRKNLSSSSAVPLEKIESSKHDNNHCDSESDCTTSSCRNLSPGFSSSDSMSPISRVCPILLSSMMSVLCSAFTNSTDGTIKISSLRQVVTEKVITIRKSFCCIFLFVDDGDKSFILIFYFVQQ